MAAVEAAASNSTMDLGKMKMNIPPMTVVKYSAFDGIQKEQMSSPNAAPGPSNHVLSSIVMEAEAVNNPSYSMIGNYICLCKDYVFER